MTDFACVICKKPFDSKDRCRKHKKCQHFGRHNVFNDMFSRYQAEASTLDQKKKAEDEEKDLVVSARLRFHEENYERRLQLLNNDNRQLVSARETAQKQLQQITSHLRNIDERIMKNPSLQKEARESMLRLQKQEQDALESSNREQLIQRNSEDLDQSKAFIQGIKRIVDSQNARRSAKRQRRERKSDSNTENVGDEIVVDTTCSGSSVDRNINLDTNDMPATTPEETDFSESDSDLDTEYEPEMDGKSP